MSKPLDLVGENFERWTVLAKAEQVKKGANRWLCRCTCGVERTVAGSDLRSGASKSCGCLSRETASEIHKTHGMRQSSEYRIWGLMRYRCRPEGEARYGGRGIRVCARWDESFENFFADMGPRPSPEHSIERRDGNGNYCHENCFWATPVVQQNNKVSSRWITAFGERRTLAQWTRKTGLGKCAIQKRLARGLAPEAALTV